MESPRLESVEIVRVSPVVPVINERPRSPRPPAFPGTALRTSPNAPLASLPSCLTRRADEHDLQRKRSLICVFFKMQFEIRAFPTVTWPAASELRQNPERSRLALRHYFAAGYSGGRKIIAGSRCPMVSTEVNAGSICWILATIA